MHKRKKALYPHPMLQVQLYSNICCTIAWLNIVCNIHKSMMQKCPKYDIKESNRAVNEAHEWSIAVATVAQWQSTGAHDQGSYPTHNCSAYFPLACAYLWFDYHLKFSCTSVAKGAGCWVVIFCCIDFHALLASDNERITM